MADASPATATSGEMNCRKRKRKGGKRPTSTSLSDHSYHDLNVPLPRTQGCLTDLMSRLRSTGYGAIALSHTTYGRPDPKKDAAGVVLQDSILESSLQASNGASAGTSSNNTKKKHRLQILKRLNAVVEELSDIAYYTESTADASGGGGGGGGSEVNDVLDSYDIVALSPRSDATFASACSTASRADIITLDYSTGRLPFKLKGSSVRAAANMGIAFELCYASAILEPSKRKALVRIALDLHNASRGVRNPSPRIILTSGARVAAGEDFGTMALRTPSDLVNVLKAVLKFGDVQAMDAMGAASAYVVARCRNRKLGLCVVPSGGGQNGTKNTVGVDAEGRNNEREASPALGSARDRIQKLIASAATTKQQKGKEESATVTKKGEERADDWTGHMQESESEPNDNEEDDDDEKDDDGDSDGFITLS